MKMKHLFFILTSATCINASAISFKIYGPCSEQPVFETTAKADLSSSVGAVTAQILDKYQIPYIGSGQGFNSIVGTPTDKDSIEIVSKDELRAYGWCYSLDGINPDQMPDQLGFKNQNSEVVWFYAYSTVKKNEWQNDYCTPAYKIKAAQFCKK